MTKRLQFTCVSEGKNTPASSNGIPTNKAREDLRVISVQEVTEELKESANLAQNTQQQ